MVKYYFIKEIEDWSYFSSIFNSKSPISFEFQSKSLLKNQKTSKWS